MWLKLAQQNANISQMMVPRFINGRWFKPMISGRRKAELRTCFNQAGVPWIYEKPTPEIHENSPYNRRPKGHKRHMNYESRITQVRKNLSTMDQKLEDLRTETHNNKPPRGLDKMIFQVLKSMKFSEKGSFQKKSVSQIRAEAAQQREAEAEMAGQPVASNKKKAKRRGVSKGGRVSKKERAAMEMSSANLNMAKQGGGYSTEAAMEIQVSKK